MKTLHLYLTRQVVASLLMTVAVFTFVFLLGNVLNEILGLLVKGKVPLSAVFEALGLLIPFVLVFALPMALLAATLLVFGRFSADHELTAARAGGISLLSLVTPILLLSLVLCGISAYVNLEFGPSCRAKYKELTFKLGARLVGAQLPEGQFIKEFKPYIIYIGKNEDGKNLKDVIIAEQRGGTNTSLFRAQRGELTVDETNRLFILNLYEVKGIRNEGGRDIIGKSSFVPFSLDYSGVLGSMKKQRISDYTFTQLREELRSLEATLAQSAPLEKMDREQLAQYRLGMQRQFADLATPIRVQMHRQVAFSFACFGFALIGIPLGIRVQRRETNISFAVALVLVLAYYSFIVAAESLATRPEWSPHLIVWIPNFLFQAVGAVLLWRANRGI